MKRALELGELSNLVDRFYFFKNSEHVLIYIITTRRKMKIGIVDFISTATPIYYNAYIAKLYRALIIMKMIKYIFYKFDSDT